MRAREIAAEAPGGSLATYLPGGSPEATTASILAVSGLSGGKGWRRGSMGDPFLRADPRFRRAHATGNEPMPLLAFEVAQCPKPDRWRGVRDSLCWLAAGFLLAVGLAWWMVRP